MWHERTYSTISMHNLSRTIRNIEVRMAYFIHRPFRSERWQSSHVAYTSAIGIIARRVINYICIQSVELLKAVCKRVPQTSRPSRSFGEVRQSD